MKIVWATDLHLDECRKSVINHFLFSLKKSKADLFLLAGDTSNGVFLKSHLELIKNHLPCPGFYVLGNHDYYFRGFNQLQNQLINLNADWNHFQYLQNLSFLSLNKKWGLIGFDGWADAQKPYAEISPIQILDFRYIKDFKNKNLKECLELMRYLGERAKARLEEKLLLAFEKHDHVIILTHVPFFEEVALHKGSNDPYWLPFMVSKLAGEKLKELLTKHPKKNSLVICGHCHTQVQKQILPNLQIKVGGAVLGKPKLETLFLDGSD